MKYYVISDIHGYYTYLMKALQEVGFFDDPEPHKLVLCGDLLDRGAETNKLIDFMIDLMEQDMLIYISGNHEVLFFRCLQELASGGVHRIASGMSYHYQNKTWDTLLQIGNMTELEAYQYPNELISRVMNSSFYKRLLPTCLNYYETKNYIFVHGWIPCLTEGVRPYTWYSYNSEWRIEDAEAWREACWYNGMDLACKFHIIEVGKTIVCGHWHTSYGHAKFENKGSEMNGDADYSPFYGEGIIALDSCAARSGFVNVIIINDEVLDDANHVTFEKYES